MSIYRIKIISKIEDKSHQSENYPAYIIVLDFRTTHFDEVSLSMEIAEILQSIGEQYPSLMGIIFAIPRKTETDISVEPMYYFVSNPFLQSKNSALNKLKNINAPSSSELIQMLIPLIIYRSGMEISVTNLCVNGLRMDQLHSMGLPVVPHDFVHD